MDGNRQLGNADPMNLIVGISGSSGAVYGLRLLEVLSEIEDVRTHLVMTPSAKLTIKAETAASPGDVEALADEVHGFKDIAAPIASGSFPVDAMIVAPCSMKSLSAIVNSYADNLLIRAADVTLKERRPLVLMPRESPLHVGHCRLLYEAAQMGAIIAPPMPGFYSRPSSVDELIDHSVGRVLDLLHIEAGIVHRWAGIDGPGDDRPSGRS